MDELSHEWVDRELLFELESAVKDLECRLAAMPGGGGVLLDYIEITPQKPGLGGYLGELLYAAFIAWWYD